jgi:hypothetical protein
MVQRLVETLDGQLVSVGLPTPATPAVAEPIASSTPAVQPELFAGASSPPLVAPRPKTAARVCPRCGYHCDDPERIHCKQCGAVLNPALQVPVEPSTPEETAPSPSDTDEPTPLESEIVASSALEPEAEVQATDPSDDPEQSADESSPPPALVDGDTSWQQPVYYPVQPRRDRSKRLLLWVTIENVRHVRTGHPALRVGLTPAPSTNPDGVNFSVEEIYQSRLRPVVFSTELKRGGVRVVRHVNTLRLGIEFWR